jgi:prephenate dehydrogenase
VDLYTGCQLILTPTEQTGTTQLAQAQALWAALGAQVRTMSALEHDSAFAAVSHLPHMLAFAAMNAIKAQAQAAHHGLQPARGQGASAQAQEPTQACKDTEPT